MATFPMTPMQAAVLGQAPTVATAGGPPMAGGMPISPAQARVLGAQAPAQAAGAAQGAGAPLPTINPAAAVLMQRAQRDEPIRTGIGLLGRLAALGVGNRIDQRNRQVQNDALNEYVGSLEPEQQRMARLAILTGNPGAIFDMAAQERGITANRELQDSREAAAMERAEMQERGAMERTELTVAGRLQAEAMKQRADASKAAVDSAMAGQKETRQALNEIGDDYRAAIGDFPEAAAQYKATIDTLERGSPTDQIAAIFSFMKTLDPSSIVTEGEIRLSAQAGGPLRQLANLVNSVSGQGDLDATTREQLAETATLVFASRAQQAEQQRRNFLGAATGRGIPPDLANLELFDYTRDIVESLEGGFDFDESQQRAAPQNAVAADSPQAAEMVPESEYRPPGRSGASRRGTGRNR